MCNRIYLTIVLAMLIALPLIQAPLIFKFGDTESGTSSTVVYNQTAVNMSDFWDNLDTPSAIEHNDLALKQGGQAGEYYHATLAQTKFWYNMSTPFFDWLSTFVYNYNQTTASTGSYNATYQSYAYNQTYTGGTFNSTYNTYAYNMTTPSGDYNYNQTYTGGTFNVTYDKWAYNMSDGSGGDYNYNESSWIISEYGKWFYNMTIATGDYNYNQTYTGGTFNTTYNTWAYNMSDGVGYDGSYNVTYQWINTTYNKWWYNHTSAIEILYGKWFYNMSDGGGAGGATYDQDLNTTANVKFNTMNTTKIKHNGEDLEIWL